MNYAQSVLQANKGNKPRRVGNKTRHARGHRGGERGERDRRKYDPMDKRRGNKNRYKDSTPRTADARAQQRRLRGRAARYKQHMRNRNATHALRTGLARGNPPGYPGTRLQPSTRRRASDRVFLDDTGIRPTGVSMRPGWDTLETASAAELLPCPPLEELAGPPGSPAWFHKDAMRLEIDRALTKVENLLIVAAQDETAKHVGPRLRKLLYRRPESQAMTKLIATMDKDRDRELLPKAPAHYNDQYLTIDACGFETRSDPKNHKLLRAWGVSHDQNPAANAAVHHMQRRFRASFSYWVVRMAGPAVTQNIRTMQREVQRLINDPESARTAEESDLYRPELAKAVHEEGGKPKPHRVMDVALNGTLESRRRTAQRADEYIEELQLCQINEGKAAKRQLGYEFEQHPPGYWNRKLSDNLAPEEARKAELDTPLWAPDCKETLESARAKFRALYDAKYEFRYDAAKHFRGIAIITAKDARPPPPAANHSVLRPRSAAPRWRKRQGRPRRSFHQPLSRSSQHSAPGPVRKRRAARAVAPGLRARQRRAARAAAPQRSSAPPKGAKQKSQRKRKGQCRFYARGEPCPHFPNCRYEHSGKKHQKDAKGASRARARRAVAVLCASGQEDVDLVYAEAASAGEFRGASPLSQARAASEEAAAYSEAIRRSKDSQTRGAYGRKAAAIGSNLFDFIPHEAGGGFTRAVQPLTPVERPAPKPQARRAVTNYFEVLTPPQPRWKGASVRRALARELLRLARTRDAKALRARAHLRPPQSLRHPMIGQRVRVKGPYDNIGWLYGSVMSLASPEAVLVRLNGTSEVIGPVENAYVWDVEAAAEPAQEARNAVLALRATPGAVTHEPATHDWPWAASEDLEAAAPSPFEVLALDLPDPASMHIRANAHNLGHATILLEPPFTVQDFTAKVCEAFDRREDQISIMMTGGDVKAPRGSMNWARPGVTLEDYGVSSGAVITIAFDAKGEGGMPAKKRSAEASPRGRPSPRRRRRNSKGYDDGNEADSEDQSDDEQSDDSDYGESKEGELYDDLPALSHRSRSPSESPVSNLQLLSRAAYAFGPPEGLDPVREPRKVRSRRVSEAQAAWSTAGQARAAPISAKDRARLAEFKEWHQQAQELRHRAQKLKRKADAVAARAEQSLASDHQSSDSALELHQQALELHQQAQELRHRAQKLKRKADAVAARAEQTLASDHQSSDSALEPCLDLWAVKAHTRARIGRTFTIDFEDAIRKRIGTLTGTVGRYNPLTQRWRIRFDDGTEMMMKEDKLDQHLARPNGSLYADDAAVQRALAADRGEPPPPAGPDPALPRPARPSPEDRLTLSDAVQRVPHGFSTRVDRDTVEAFNANHGLVGNELLSQNASTAFVDPALKRDGPENSRNHPDHRRRRFHRAWRAAFLRGDPAARQALSQAMPSSDESTTDGDHREVTTRLHNLGRGGGRPRSVPPQTKPSKAPRAPQAVQGAAAEASRRRASRRRPGQPSKAPPQSKPPQTTPPRKPPTCEPQQVTPSRDQPQAEKSPSPQPRKRKRRAATPAAGLNGDERCVRFAIPVDPRTPPQKLAPRATVTADETPEDDYLLDMVTTQEDVMWASDGEADNAQPRIDSFYPAVAQTTPAEPPRAADQDNFSSAAQSLASTAAARLGQQQQADAVGVETRSKAARRAAEKQRRRTAGQADSSPVSVAAPAPGITAETLSPGAEQSDETAASTRAHDVWNL